ncbi:hypothetical protein [Sporosarcina highlanderae]|uniref:Uncharacterized protein n=1 Tax=Sporosarcina highlanderae TaxID=3035916 RepID=A0ABT8JLU7_9BACL|nr:hypothetical protein [Sporosarcina highlanderae]MDN4606128.1 hypothetical protein [Sporosarcina highlanderae]
MLGKNSNILSSGRQPKEYYAQMWKAISGKMEGNISNY